MEHEGGESQPVVALGAKVWNRICGIPASAGGLPGIEPHGLTVLRLSGGFVGAEGCLGHPAVQP